MPAAYLDDFVQELRQVGEVAFRRRHTTPVLIVTGRAARGERAGADDVTRAVSAPESDTRRRGAPLALVHRVFPVVKAPHAPAGPVSLGRTPENDVSIPEYSISKRHCLFDLSDGVMSLTDAGSTNGTLINGSAVDATTPVPLCGGEIITLGRFAFLYETPAGFLEYVSGLVK
jgi:FHA domain